MAENNRFEIESALPVQLQQLLNTTGGLAAKRKEAAFLVGGVVRDMLLNRKTTDLDVVIEGEAIPVAKAVARQHKCRLQTHPRFGTAKITTANHVLDLVTARSETYAFPGALPTVQPATIIDDLARRDFTVNAMALLLSPDKFGELLDPHGGQQDLDRKRIRILYPASFIDDPTRILRAVRYEQRLGFSLEAETEKQLRQHVHGLGNVSGARLWNELKRVLEEAEPESSFYRADYLGVLPVLFPPFRISDQLGHHFRQARNSGDRSLSLPAIYLAILSFRFTPEEAAQFPSRFNCPKWASRTVRDTVQLRNTAVSLSRADMPPGQIDRILRDYQPEAIKGVSIAVESPLLENRLTLYLDRLRYVKCELDGNDLLAMGVPAGRRLGQTIRRLREARLDGTVTTREEEQSLVSRWL